MTSSTLNSAGSLFDLPDFENISAADIRPMTDALLKDLEARWQALASDAEYTFDSLVHGHQALLHELGRRWSPISHLNMVAHSDDWQREYLAALADITEFSSRLAQDRRLFEGYQAVAAALPEDSEPQQHQVVAHALRDFRLAGVDLDDAGQAEYRELMQRLSALQAQFANNVQACSDAWSWHTESETTVAGIPDNLLRQAAQNAQAADKDGWLFDLSQPVYQAVMTHARAEDTRKHFYAAWMTRAARSEQHDHNYDNTDLIDQILRVRQSLATLLGFDSYADYSLAAKMAGSVDEVLSFLDDLRTRSVVSAQQELEDFTKLAGRPLNAWDIAFYSERYKAARYSISDDVLRPYFPAERVVDGLFELAERLYGLSLQVHDGIEVWHPTVRFYSVHDSDGKAIGGFYADLYARSGKRGGAWIDECVVRAGLDQPVTLPVGYLVCNFSPADDATPSLLSHSDVVTLFHEFGHMLHHLLTRIDYPTIAGINGVPWDAVELPSQFMENFAWHYGVLHSCSQHYETGQQLPKETFDLLLQARNVGAGLQMLRQLEFALFDFRLHNETGALPLDFAQQLIARTRTQTSLFDVPDYARFENSFTHIFAGGYAAGYYSYKWAEVLAADAFAAFDEVGDIYDQRIAQSFREHILEIGGSRDIQDAYVDFRGRPAQIDALLASAGIIAA
ncbi:MAG: M3 family metallopeptidase [Pseudomonadota bacterium]